MLQVPTGLQQRDRSNLKKSKNKHCITIIVTCNYSKVGSRTYEYIKYIIIISSDDCGFPQKNVSGIFIYFKMNGLIQNFIPPYRILF